MKTILSALAIAAASTALAVESSNTFGILRVDSTTAQTIISVPWEGAGTTTDNAIKVKDVIKTANLTVGDQLYYYSNGSYKMWLLTAEGWQGAQSVKSEGGVVDAAQGDNTEIFRGGAIILVRQNPTTGTPAVANPFYLYGQYTSKGASIKCVAGGHTLIAPSKTTDFDLNGVNVMTGSPAQGDYIVVDLGKILTYKAGKWGQKKTTIVDGFPTDTTHDTAVAVIPAGTGVWYVSTGDTAPTFNF